MRYWQSKSSSLASAAGIFAAVVRRLFLLVIIPLPLLPFVLPLTQHMLSTGTVFGFVCFAVTALTGLSGKHTLFSKGITLVLGLMGTSLVVLLHHTVVFHFTVALQSPLGVVLDAYLSLLLVCGYLVLFWWVTDRFVLKAQTSPCAFVLTEPQEREHNA